MRIFFENLLKVGGILVDILLKLKHQLYDDYVGYLELRQTPVMKMQTEISLFIIE